MPTLAKRFLLLLAALLAICPSLSAEEPNRNIRFGMPSPARADPEQRDDYLIARPQYVLSYNAEKPTPNWVSWCLRRSDIGRAERGPFEPDPLLPRGFARVTSHVYDGSGFDRGHMCPAKDRSATQADCDATFYMTNVVPQSPASNQKGWERLESYCRRLAQRGHELHIVCGPHGVGGIGKNGYREEIGRGRLKVTVPAKLWKVVLVLPHKDAEPHKNTRVISIIMPNDQTVDFDWTKYRVSARAVEKLTGYTFFRNVPGRNRRCTPRAGRRCGSASPAPEGGQPMKKDLVLDALRKASMGLRYTSETDADLKPFVWDNGDDLTPQRLCERVVATPNTAVEVTTLDSFLRAVPSEDRAKFQKLAQVLKEHLSDIKVYKLGKEAEKEVYIVGKTADGRWAGLKTTVVET